MYSNLSINELEQLLKEKKIIIYGTGHIGKKFLLALKRLGLVEQITCFTKTGHVEQEENVNVIPVYTLSQINVGKNSIVCLAVHESIRDEMIEELKRNQIENYVWIYPYLYELLLGAPLKENIPVSVARLKVASKNDYRMAIRFLAIEQYLGKNDCGFDMYIRALSLHCSQETAKKRAEQFCRLIDDWSMSGYNSEYKVQLSQNYEIVDGNHRVALAMYFGEKNILCDMFFLSYPISNLHGEGAMLTKEILLESGFKKEEIQLLDEMMKQI